ncbi:hypothetical protein QAD02_009914 [Eretmocerus hayati]|uniref:Uncharacterized protein n=1 Tax=Eretmocerus hayati TaxID=131215 RepID=A0ACC2NBH6_9HYME|nr:hypothetical protein QAD02_009914 [Eretmocerus hayati]
MNQQHSNEYELISGLSYGFDPDPSGSLKKFQQLESAVSLKQTDIIESLLEEGVEVNRHPLYCNVRTPLHSSIRVGDIEIVKKLLHHGASVNADYDGDTPLTLAAKMAKYEICDLLLSNKGLQNITNDEKITPVHIASMRNQVAIVKKLLQSRYNVNDAVSLDTDYWPGFTPIHFAVQFQCIETVEFLLGVGADITKKDSRQRTPLHLAHLLRDERIIDMILLAHLNIVSNPVDSRGLSHFHIACSRNNPKVVEYFIKLGVNLADQIQEKTFLNKGAINLAIKHECTDVVRLLLQCSDHVSLNANILDGCIKDAFCTGNREILHLLCAVKKIDRNVSGIQEFPTYFQSFFQSDIEIIKKSIPPSGEALNKYIISNGCTILHVAIECRHEEVCELLVKRGANYNIQNLSGRSPLHLAFKYNMLKIVDLMLENHKILRVNVTDDDSLSFLHIACARNNVRIAKRLLKLGADVDCPVSFESVTWPGFTPLHFAAQFGCKEVSLALLEHGASYSATNASNLTAFDIVFRRASLGVLIEPPSIMESILTFHSWRKDKLFNDRGFSLLHLDSEIFNRNSCKTLKMMQTIGTHLNDINKTIHNMNTKWDGYTPLHFALLVIRNEKYAKLLIKAGADIFVKASNGDTVLHLHNALISNPETIELENPRILQLNHIGSEGRSIFHVACAQGNLKLVKYFLEHGVDPNFSALLPGTGCDDDAPLHTVISSNLDRSLDLVNLLLSHGANPNIRDSDKNVPLHFMLDNHHTEIIDVLVSHGADINAQNAFYETPLMYICDNSTQTDPENLKKNIVSFLNNGANINLTDISGKTPLSVDRVTNIDQPMSLDFLSSIEPLLEHVIKLERIESYVSDTNTNICDTLLQGYSNELHIMRNFFSEKCTKEIELLKRLHINSYTKLHHVLSLTPNNLAVLSQNKVFQQIVSEDNFCQKLPIYGPMIKSNFKQGQIRWPLLRESQETLGFILGNMIPSDCAENILKYLDNEDLRNVILCKKL